MIKQKTLSIALSLVMLFTASGTVAMASVSGTNAAKVDVTVKTKQGGTWITARKDTTDKKGLLSFKNVLPGKYKFIIDKDDVAVGQTLAVKLRLLDHYGRAIKNKRATVNISVYIGDMELPVATYHTHKNGWLNLTGITSGTTYKIDVADDMHIGKKTNRPRVKVKAKIDGSNWFPVAYKRINANGWLTVKDVLPGFYKFKYKRTDVGNVNQPFNLVMRVRNADGDHVKYAKVKIYAYPFGVKTYIGTFKTDRKGYIRLPGVMPNMKYKIKVRD